MATVTPETIAETTEKPLILEDPKKKFLELPALPCKKGTQTSKDAAFRWFDSIKETELKKHITIYSYRIHPKIVMPAPIYIQKYDGLENWSENQFIADHGGGIYKFDVYAVGNDHSVFNFKYEVDSTVYEPIFDLKFLDYASRDNKSWIDSQKNKGRIKQTSKGLEWVKDKEAPMYNTSGSPTEVIEAITGVFEKFASMNQQKSDPQLTAILAQLSKQESFGAKDIAALITSMTPLILPLLAPKPQDDTMVKLLIAQAEASKEEAKSTRASMDALLTKMMDTKPTDPFAMVLKVKEIEQMFTKEKPEEEPKSRFDKFLDMFASMAPALAPGLLGMMKPPNMQQLPSGQPNGALPQYPVIPQNQPLAVPQVNPQVLLQTFNDPSFAEILSSKLNEDIPGWLVGYQLEDIAGKSFHNQICQFDKSVILGCLAQSQVRAKLKPEVSAANLDKFIDDFINYESFNSETGKREPIQ